MPPRRTPVRDLAPVAQADPGRGIGLDPKDPVGVLDDPRSAVLVVRVPARCEEAARAANDELLGPLTEDERARLTGLVRRIAGAEAEAEG